MSRWMEIWKFAKVNPPQKSTHHNVPKTQQYMDFLSLEALQEDVFGSVKVLGKVRAISQTSSTDIITNT